MRALCIHPVSRPCHIVIAALASFPFLFVGQGANASGVQNFCFGPAAHFLRAPRWNSALRRLLSLGSGHSEACYHLGSVPLAKHHCLQRPQEAGLQRLLPLGWVTLKVLQSNSCTEPLHSGSKGSTTRTARPSPRTWAECDTAYLDGAHGAEGEQPWPAACDPAAVPNFHSIRMHVPREDSLQSFQRKRRPSPYGFGQPLPGQSTQST